MQLYPNPHGESCYWHSATEKFGAPSIKWCEETLCQVVSEPANTWSNLGYLVSAIVLYIWARKSKHNELKWFAPAMFLMGAASFYFHMSNYYVGQVLDFIGMYLFVFWLLVLNLRKAKLIKRNKQILTEVIIIIGCTSLVHYMYINHLNFQNIVAAGVIGILLTEFIAFKVSKKTRNYKYFWTSIALMGVAQIFSQLDLRRIMCDPHEHIFQGHAIWHTIGAVALTIAYKHWEQEDYSQEIID